MSHMISVLKHLKMVDLVGLDIKKGGIRLIILVLGKEAGGQDLINAVESQDEKHPEAELGHADWPAAAAATH